MKKLFTLLGILLAVSLFPFIKAQFMGNRFDPEAFNKKGGLRILLSVDVPYDLPEIGVESVLHDAFDIIRNRVDRLGVQSSRVELLDTDWLILVELPGVKEPDRVRKTLLSSGNLELWETYDFIEVITSLEEVDNYLATIQKQSGPTEYDYDDDRPVHPLFSLLKLNAPGPVIGYAHTNDLEQLEGYFSMREVKELLPRDLQFRWAVKPINEDVPYFHLYAIKITNRYGTAPIDGEYIVDAVAKQDYKTGLQEINIMLNSEGSQIWAALTRQNIGKAIAIVMDDLVFAAPVVRSEIPNGRMTIAVNFTPEEAKDLANLIKSGKMPTRVRLVQEEVVSPATVK